MENGGILSRLYFHTMLLSVLQKYVATAYALQGVH